MALPPSPQAPFPGPDTPAQARKTLAKGVIERFERECPDPPSELNHRDPFQLLVAVILSAQCTDARVNAITPALFREFPDPERLARASEERVFQLIASCSYPNSKAKHLVRMAQGLQARFQGRVPSDLHDLLTLPGVGRKTANVVRSIAFGVPSLGVDTHVRRVSYRLGLVPEPAAPDRVERELTAIIPREYWTRAHLWLVLHGRYVCRARRPECHECIQAEICQKQGLSPA